MMREPTRGCHMRAKRAGWFLGLAAAVIAVAAVPVFAQVETSDGVARVSLVQGDVTVQRADSGTWVAATINTPLVPGDAIATGQGARAEVQVDYADVVRLDQNTEVKIADLTRSRIQLQVGQGLVDYVVLQNPQATSEVDTPNVAVEPSGQGVFRIDVNSQDLSIVTVRQGQSQIATPQGSTTVNEGQQITLQGTQNPEYQIADAQPQDGWDQWNSQRDSVISRAQNYQHVNHYYTGAQDLDAYGHWVYVPNHDWCWTPYVDAGWVPYSAGSWVWEPYWGWTWVSYEPWGWAPYHYGRWFLYGNSWMWWPGYVTAGYYPAWGPAYVSFIGFGYGRYNFGFGSGYGFRSIGWCPLGPRDDFHPWWGRGHSFSVGGYPAIANEGGPHPFRAGSRGFVHSNLQMALTNERVRRAITVVPADRFGAGRVARTGKMVTVADLRTSNVVRGTLPVVPTRASLSASSRTAAVPRVARNVGTNTRYFSRNGSSAPPRAVPFTSQAASVRQMMQDHPQQAAARANARGSVAAGTGAREARAPSPARVEQQGRNQAVVPRRVQAGRQTENQPPAQQGWKRFGAPASQSETAPRGRAPWPAAVNHGTRGQANAPATGRQDSAAPARTVDRGAPNKGWQQFSRSAPSARVQSSPGNRAPERGSSPRQAPAQQNQNRQPQRQGWNQFTSRPRPQTTSPDQGRGRDFSRPAPNSGQGQGNGWNRFGREPTSRSGNTSRQNRRPPLQLNRPMVTRRQQQNNNSHFSNHNSAPRYSAPRYSAPHYSAPRNSAPHYSAPRYSAPHYSAPHYSAPHYSAPHYSAPARSSGGGGRGWGGGHGGRSRH